MSVSFSFDSFRLKNTLEVSFTVSLDDLTEKLSFSLVSFFPKHRHFHSMKEKFSMNRIQRVPMPDAIIVSEKSFFCLSHSLTHFCHIQACMNHSDFVQRMHCSLERADTDLNIEALLGEEFNSVSSV